MNAFGNGVFEELIGDAHREKEQHSCSESLCLSTFGSQLAKQHVLQCFVSPAKFSSTDDASNVAVAIFAVDGHTACWAVVGNIAYHPSFRQLLDHLLFHDMGIPFVTTNRQIAIVERASGRVAVAAVVPEKSDRHQSLRDMCNN